MFCETSGSYVIGYTFEKFRSWDGLRSKTVFQMGSRKNGLALLLLFQGTVFTKEVVIVTVVSQFYLFSHYSTLSEEVTYGSIPK